jgi:hypothetical protein
MTVRRFGRWQVGHLPAWHAHWRGGPFEGDEAAARTYAWPP